MKTISRGKKPFLLSMISFIVVMLMIVGCGGGGGTGPVVPDTQQPIIHEMKYEGEAGTDITSDNRAAAQGTLYVKASDNQTQSNQLTFDIKNGNGSFTSHTVTKGNDGYYVKEVAMTPQNIYGRGNFDGFDATARVRDATGNGTLEKRFFDLALSEQAGRRAITEAKINVSISNFDAAGGFTEDQQVEIQGRNVSVDLVGHFTGGDSGWRELSVKYYNINDTQDAAFQNIVFNQGNVRIAKYTYLGGNNRGYFLWLETNLDYNTSKDTLEAAFNFIKTDSGLAGNDVTITAQASPASGGDVRINSGTWGDSKNVTVNSGTQVTLEASAVSGYTFEGWYDGTVKVSSNTSYQVTATANKTYKANFTQNVTQYTITAQASPASGGDVRINSGTWGDSKNVTVNSGTQVTLEASEVTGYGFEGWYDGSVKVSSNKTYQVTATANKTYKANFMRVTFYMGNTRDDPEGDTDEKPVHGVILTYSYYIATHELTFNEYDAYCDDKGIPKPSDQGWGRGTRPVINVSWWDAIKYCNWLSIENGFAPAYNETTGALLDKSGNVTTDITTVEGYRLPTEAEWEYAARGGIADITNGNEANDYKYAGSNTLNEVGWYTSNSGNKTHPVGQKEPNELGLYDMSGNVYEWCHDWYGGYASTTQTNPTGPSSGSLRVGRGGCWYGSALGCRVADRGSLTPASSGGILGFRLSRTSF